jgi:hypothetical protein
MSTMARIHNVAANRGWKARCDNHIQLRTEQDGLIVHVEWTRSGAVRWATLERVINDRGTAQVIGVRGAGDRNKAETVIHWLRTKYPQDE